MAAKRSKKSDDLERPIMDADGSSAAAPTFMHERAQLDRKDAATAALDAALSRVKTMAASITKAISHGQSTEGDDMKMACLDEVATIGNKIRDKGRAAIRDAKKALAGVKEAAQ